MKIERLMTPDVYSCGPEDTLDRAAKVMWEHDCGVVPVTDGGRVVGMITDRDICMAGYFQGKALREIPVQQVMARQVVACALGDDIATAEAKMREHRVRRLPVTHQGKLVGILSLNDLAVAMQHGKSSGNGVAVDQVANTLGSISAHRIPVLVTPSLVRPGAGAAAH